MAHGKFLVVKDRRITPQQRPRTSILTRNARARMMTKPSVALDRRSEPEAKRASEFDRQSAFLATAKIGAGIGCVGASLYLASLAIRYLYQF